MRYDAFCCRFELSLLARISLLLVLCRQTQTQNQTTCPPECSERCTDQYECCPPGTYWRDSSTNDTNATTTFPVTSPESVTSRSQCHLCSDVIDNCEACKFNSSSGEVICGQCVAGFELSPRGVACDPAEESTPPDWLVPVVVVLAVVLLAAVAVAVTWVVRRRQHPPRPRPPLPRPDELGVLPSDWTSKKLRRSTFGRNRYTRTPKSQRPPPQGIATIGRLRERVPSVVYQKRDGVLPVRGSSTSPSTAAEISSGRSSSVVNEPAAPMSPDQDIIYANCADEEGEIYANDDVETQPAVTDGASAATADGRVDNVGVMEDEYQNEIEMARTAGQQPSSSGGNDSSQEVYENVPRKPKPKVAPKPTRRL